MSERVQKMLQLLQHEFDRGYMHGVQEVLHGLQQHDILTDKQVERLQKHFVRPRDTHL